MKRKRRGFGASIMLNFGGNIRKGNVMDNPNDIRNIDPGLHWTYLKLRHFGIEAEIKWAGEELHVLGGFIFRADYDKGVTYLWTPEGRELDEWNCDLVMYVLDHQPQELARLGLAASDLE